MKFFVHRLGCPKNDVDADYISARLIADGHEPVKQPEEAESVIVNTCGFILPAKEESIGEILQMGQLKKTGNLKTLYVSGCLAQRYGDELLQRMPEIDGAFGLGTLDSIADAVGRSSQLQRVIKVESHKLSYLDWNDRLITDEYPYAYLKISDGCNRVCSFCAIPAIRGRFRSRPLDSILKEAEFLAAKGKKELILVSQEATLWGHDLPEHPNVVTLLKELDRVEGVKWLRLMYLYPSMLTTELIDYLSADNKSLDYFDLPLQHCNSEILSAMGRRSDRSAIERLLKLIRSRSPNGTIRTVFITGFPGETEEQFEELKDFVRAQQFDRMGTFIYSPEEGTPAEQLPGQIAEEVKFRRLDELMCLQHDIALARNNSLIGSIQEVIIDVIDDNGLARGRTRGDCPEIDQEVFVHGDELRVGQFCRVIIEAVDEYDLIGVKLEG